MHDRKENAYSAKLVQNLKEISNGYECVSGP